MHGAVLSTSTADLVHAARRGDRSAMRALYERFAPAVHGCLLARVHPQDAEDLMHDSFARAFERLASLREPAAFPGWLLQIARNLAHSWHRRLPDSDAGLEELPASTAGPDAVSEAHALLGRLCRQPEKVREVLILRLVEGLNGPEIAEATGLTHGTVRVYLHEGLQRLRAELDPPRSGALP